MQTSRSSLAVAAAAALAFGVGAGASIARPLPATPAPATSAKQPSTLVSTTQKSLRLGPVSRVTSWGYNLQNLDVAALVASPYDVLVIDYSRDGSEDGRLTLAELRQLKTKPDGTRRVVLSYLSIGEAESYRYYWKWTWGGTWYTEPIGWIFAPPWLGSQNAEWGGNYAVRYWDPRWKAVILGAGGYLDRIIQSGFDGVWLDKVDSSIERVAKSRPTAEDDMRTFVAEIAAHGRQKAPGFLVVPQNGEELLTDAKYRQVIDAIGKEDLLYGEFKDKAANPADGVARRTDLLKLLTRDGKPVLAVEYIDNAAHIAAARKTLTEAGFVPHFADRSLETLRIGDLPTASSRRGRWSSWWWPFGRSR